jgi:predicted nuclease of restriction endonuclease-like RecB superfamily
MVRWVPGVARTLPAGTVSALAEQSVTIPATAQYGRVIRGLADLLLTELKLRATSATVPPAWSRSNTFRRNSGG